jgi:peptidoglycan hydrolase-like protein with peptidoglycan-binding domain/surface antigen
MKKIAKVAASLCLSLVLLVACLPTMAVHAESSFVPRLTAPSSDNPYYFSDLNLYYRYGYGMPNCTAYAYGRVYEILGHEPSLSRWNAGQWWFDNANYGWYSYGSTPQVGAVVCWDRWDQNSGHVAVVEEVYNDGTILISESSWGGTMFRTRVMNGDGSDYLENYRFLGYIYACSGMNSGGSAESGVRPTLSVGSRGSYVSELQQELYELGYLNTAPDGAFGVITESAVRVFQKSNSLVADGIVGSATWAKLFSDDVIGAANSGIGETETPDDDQQEQPENSTPITPDNNETVIDPSSMPILRKGSIGSSVAIMQTLLNERGYNAGAADGIFGSGTYNAVIAFQRASSLSADGIVGYNTWSALAKDNVTAPEVSLPSDKPSEEPSTDNSASFDPASMPMLRLWSTGENVKTMQNILNTKGYNAGSVDGIFGNGTYSAVIAFQRANGLVADGIVGYNTWSALAK